ncbi:hypothetical protein AB0N61_13365 [Microbacterium sp. NPDC089320]|uniref:hypothetical protein n=1 Tax=Microbacterium sp. NPDC089320 TaxID=3155182 RepID=UPI0034225D8F
MSGDSNDPYIRPEDAVIPPPPPESVVPDAVIPPPPPESAVPDAVIPPPPPEAMPPSTRRSRPRPAILTGDQPSPAADDWAQPSVAPVEPTSGEYRALSVVIFGFLIVLLAAAIAGAVYLGATVTFAQSPDAADVVAGTATLWHG